MNPRTPTDELTNEEAEIVREYAQQHGLRAATEHFGLRNTEALAKAIARLRVHRLTVLTIRGRIPSRI